jgi:hypothetical protein
MKNEFRRAIDPALAGGEQGVFVAPLCGLRVESGARRD